MAEIDDNNDEIRERSQKKRLRVTFGREEPICYNSATATFVACLSKIGPAKLKKIKLYINHFPLFTNQLFEEMKEYQKPIGEGWYVTIQSDTITKYLQLLHIKERLKLNMKLEIGTDFESTKPSADAKQRKDKSKMLVKLPGNIYVAEDTPLETYLQTLNEIGIDEIRKKNVIFSGKEVITDNKKYSNQIQVGINRWAVVPALTKEKSRLLKIIALMLRLKIEVSIFE